MPYRFAVSVFLVLALFAGSAQAQILLDRPNLDLRTDGTVHALARLSNGSVIVGGQFQSINDLPRSNIARLRPDGSVDPAWAPQVDGPVFALTLAPDDAIIAGGSFTRVNGISLPYLAKLDSASGAPVATWRPAPNSVVWALAESGPNLYVGGMFGTLGGVARASIGRVGMFGTGVADDWNPSANGVVYALTVVPGLLSAPDTLVVGGSFTEIGGVARDRIARLSVNMNAAVMNWNPSMNGAVYALANDAATVYAGGSFTMVGPRSIARLARIPVDSNLPLNDFAPQPDDWVQSLSLLGGTLHVGGWFTTIGGLPRAGVARMNTAGVVDANWNPGAPGSRVYAVRGRSDGVAYVGGSFRRSAGQVRLALARIDADGGSSVPTHATIKGRVAALARQSDGALIVGGEFALADGQPRGNLLRLDASGQLDPQWAPATDGDIFDLAVDGSDRVYAAGQFERVNGLPLRSVVRLAAAGDGAPDTGWDAAVDFFVRALAIQADGEIIVGGSFTSIGGLPRNRIARLSALNAAADPAWNPDPDNWVRTVAVAADGSIFAGGWFDTVGGVPRTRVARLAATDGSVVPAWNATVDGDVNALAFSPDGTHVYLGGNFTQAGGAARPGGLARVAMATGALDADWAPPVEYSTAAIGVDERGEVYAAGSLRTPGSQLFLYRLSATDGEIAPDWQFATDLPLSVVLVHAGKVWVGGQITSVMGQPRVGIAAVVVDRIFANGFEQVQF